MKDAATDQDMCEEKRLMYCKLNFHACLSLLHDYSKASYASTHIYRHRHRHTGQQQGGTMAAQCSIRLPGIHTASAYQLMYHHFVGQHISTRCGSRQREEQQQHVRKGDTIELLSDMP